MVGDHSVELDRYEVLFEQTELEHMQQHATMLEELRREVGVRKREAADQATCSQKVREEMALSAAGSARSMREESHKFVPPSWQLAAASCGVGARLGMARGRGNFGLGICCAP